MRRIWSQNTNPELLLRHAPHKQALHYRIHVRVKGITKQILKRMFAIVPVLAL